jgi:hypothetical protein
MPSEHTLRYAIPLCYAPRMERKGQHGWHFTCYRPLRYAAPDNLWRCFACGNSVSGGLVAARAGTCPTSDPVAALWEDHM